MISLEQPVTMRTSTPLPAPLVVGQPLTALAPMQDVTDLAFMGVIAHYGAPDYFFTEFLRVHSQSRPEKHILRAIDENATGRPIFAQLIGEDLAHLARTAAELRRHPIAGIDLNLGCPAPKVYKKNVGGGLLRDLDRVDQILATLRAACSGLFTVKMRIGFDDTSPLDRMLELANRHEVDLLSIHGRTVKEMYRSEVRYEFIRQAVTRVRCPVLANGNITSADRAAKVIDETRAAGVMIGRHAIRNPWIFRQCRERWSVSAASGQSDQPSVAIFQPTLTDVREYVERLYRATDVPELAERYHVNKMKKYLNFVGQSVDPAGAFLHDMRRTETEKELFRICDLHLLGAEQTFSVEPFPGVIARPNCETPEVSSDGCSLETITA
jgi:tRNA-dihydrouridine synthase B